MADDHTHSHSREDKRSKLASPVEIELDEGKAESGEKSVDSRKRKTLKGSLGNNGSEDVTLACETAVSIRMSVFIRCDTVMHRWKRPDGGGVTLDVAELRSERA